MRRPLNVSIPVDQSLLKSLSQPSWGVI